MITHMDELKQQKNHGREEIQAHNFTYTQTQKEKAVNEASTRNTSIQMGDNKAD